MFSRQQIADAKKDTHTIVFAPGTRPRTCAVTKVRGQYVWVLCENGPPVRLNATASRSLIDGKYR